MAFVHIFTMTTCYNGGRMELRKWRQQIMQNIGTTYYRKKSGTAKKCTLKVMLGTKYIHSITMRLKSSLLQGYGSRNVQAILAEAETI